MNYLNGGYVMIKHNATQKDLAAAYKSNRPVLVYDENQRAHWAQINETVTTETVDDEVVTTYTYSYQLINAIESLTDSAGNLRFIEGECEINTLLPEGVEISYARWSLSGTHFMIVVDGTLADTTAFNAIKICDVSIPEYIGKKIYPVFLSKIEYKTATAYAENYTQQQLSISLSKFSNTNLQVVKEGNTTLTADRAFRIQFDLLIDNDYSE